MLTTADIWNIWNEVVNVDMGFDPEPFARAILSTAPTTVIPEQSDECASCGNKIGNVMDHEQWCSRRDHALLSATEERDSFRRVSESLQQQLNEAEELNRKFMHETNGPIFLGEPANHAAPTTGSAPINPDDCKGYWIQGRVKHYVGYPIVSDPQLVNLSKGDQSPEQAAPASPGASVLTDAIARLNGCLEHAARNDGFTIRHVAVLKDDLRALLAASMGGDIATSNIKETP